MLKPSEGALILALFGWELSTPNSTPSTPGILPVSLTRSATVSSQHSRTGPAGPPARTAASMSSAAARGRPRYSYDSAAASASPEGTPPPMLRPVSRHSPLSNDGTPSDSAVISCALCQRRVGIWGFRPHAHLAVVGRQNGRSASGGSNGTDLTSTSAPASSASSQHHQPHQQQQKVLDVVREHRSYCPYIVRSTPLPTFSFSLP